MDKGNKNVMITKIDKGKKNGGLGKVI